MESTTTTDTLDSLFAVIVIERQRERGGESPSDQRRRCCRRRDPRRTIPSSSRVSSVHPSLPLICSMEKKDSFIVVFNVPLERGDSDGDAGWLVTRPPELHGLWTS